MITSSGLAVPVTVWNYANYIKEVVQIVTLGTLHSDLSPMLQNYVSKCPEDETIEDVSCKICEIFSHLIVLLPQSALDRMTTLNSKAQTSHNVGELGYSKFAQNGVISRYVSYDSL